MEKISVIIPVYNAEKDLNKALRSVTEQSLKDLEIICVDDGSTDGSAKIIKNKMNEDTRIKYFYQENKGAGAARNLGISKANGEFIAFLDADDQFADNTALEKLYVAAINNKVSVCGGSAKYFNGEEPEKYKFHQSQLVKFEYYQFDFFFFRFISQRKLLINHNIKFPETRVYEDPIFLIKSLYAAKEFYVIPDFIYLYSGAHTSADLSLKKTKDYLRGLTEELTLSSNWKYKKLHQLVFERVNNTANYYFEKYLYTGDKELLSLLLKCNYAIDRKLIDDVCSEDYVIPAISTMWRAGTKYLEISKKIKRITRR